MDYVTLAEIRALPQMSNLTLFPDSVVTAVADSVESQVETIVGTSFVGRVVTGEQHDGGLDGFPLAAPFVVSIQQVLQNGVVVAATLHDNRVFRTDGQPWAVGRFNVTVDYTAGYSLAPPADIKHAVLLATRMRVLSTSANSRIDARRTGLNTEHGTESFGVARADRTREGGGRPFGYPEVDSIVLGWKDRLQAVTDVAFA